MQNREKIIAAIMIVTIALWVTLKMPKMDKRAAHLDKKSSAALPDAQEPPEEEYGIDIENVLAHALIKSGSKDRGGIKNPFDKVKPAVVVEKKEFGIDDLVLSGIIWEKETPVILINEQILRVGDYVSGYRVEEIREHEGVLSKDGKTYTLKLFEE